MMIYVVFSDYDECCAEAFCRAEKAICTNTPSSFICMCDKGYLHNGTYCEGKQQDYINSSDLSASLQFLKRGWLLVSYTKNVCWVNIQQCPKTVAFATPGGKRNLKIKNKAQQMTFPT